MQETKQKSLVDLISVFANHYNLNTTEFKRIEDRQHILDALKIANSELAEVLKNLIIQLDSLHFTKHDKELRLKAYEIYKMEMIRIKADLDESLTKIEKYSNNCGIQIDHLIEALRE